jgi:hypothetical protein
MLQLTDILSASAVRWQPNGGYINGEFFTLHELSRACGASVADLLAQKAAGRTLKQAVQNKPIFPGRNKPGYESASDPKIQALTAVITQPWRAPTNAVELQQTEGQTEAPDSD